MTKMITREEQKKLREALRGNPHITERERLILEMRFGFKDGMTHTLEDIGKVFNVTRERIRQLEAKALEKVRMFDELLIKRRKDIEKEK